MRLIDADALLKGRQDHDFIDTHVIYNAPTVEAIPISWIEKYIENAGFIAVLNSHSVEFMLRQWHREKIERKEE